MPSPLRETTEQIIFNGIPFRRYPNSPRRELSHYYTSQGGQRLHRAIWEHHNGSIPDGHHIHHRDGNSLNNDIANLECLTAHDHLSSHMDEERRNQAREHANTTLRAGYKDWLATDEGSEWIKQHTRRLGKMVWENRKPEPRKCVQCGADYESVTLRDNDRFCSNNCKSAHRRASKVDDEDRTCGWCGKVFRASRYAIKQGCSRSCGTRIGFRAKAGLQPSSG